MERRRILIVDGNAELRGVLARTGPTVLVGDDPVDDGGERKRHGEILMGGRANRTLPRMRPAVLGVQH